MNEANAKALRALDSIQRDFDKMLTVLMRIVLDPQLTLKTAREIAENTLRDLEGDVT